MNHRTSNTLLLLVVAVATTTSVFSAATTNNKDYHNQLRTTTATTTKDAGNNSNKEHRNRKLFFPPDFDLGIDFGDIDFGGSDGNENNGWDWDWDWDGIFGDGFDFSNLDGVDWNTFLDFLGLDGDQGGNMNIICPIIEGFIGMGQAFGVAGNCTCNGTILDGLTVDCHFDDQCIEDVGGLVSPSSSSLGAISVGGEALCGSVSLNVTLGQNVGSISTDVCVDLDGPIPEICYEYDMDVLPDSTIEQTCTATYDGQNNQCICSIQDGCVLIDCSQFLPGADMDTCQQVQATMKTADDANNFVPEFRLFQPDFSLDFGAIDWENLDWENFNFGELFWNHTSDFWENNIDNIQWGDIFGIDFNITDICPALEQFAGLGQAFGIAGGCTCNGDLVEGLGIDCSFSNECVGGIPTLPCGSVDFNVSLGEEPNTYTTSVCVDLFGEDGGVLFPEICYSYSVSVVDSTISQSCEATYGDLGGCSCNIENFCLSIDCSTLLPGAVMDTCQHMDVIVESTTDNTAALMPRFGVFEPDFELDFGSVDWMSIDWLNLDWPNFDIDSLWNHSDWESIDLSDMFNVDVDPANICPVLEQMAGLGENFGFAGGCSCSGDSDSGLALDCLFEEVCVGDDNDLLCAGTNLTFDFDGLGSISGEACVDFVGDSHPTTCFLYNIPLADPDTPSECTASYGGSNCGCTIDENFCVSINCTEHDVNAVTDTCQILSWNTADDATTFVPRFAPKSGETDAGQQEDGKGDSPNADKGNVSNALTDNSSAGVAFRSFFVTGLGIWSILLLL